MRILGTSKPTLTWLLLLQLKRAVQIVERGEKKECPPKKHKLQTPNISPICFYSAAMMNFHPKQIW